MLVRRVASKLKVLSVGLGTAGVIWTGSSNYKNTRFFKHIGFDKKAKCEVQHTDLVSSQTLSRYEQCIKQSDAPEKNDALQDEMVKSSHYPGSRSILDSAHAFLSVSLFVFAWSLTILTPFMVLWMLFTGQKIALGVYGCFWVANVAGWRLPRSDWLRNWLVSGMSKWMTNGVSMKIQSSESKHPKMYCFHPHGILSFSFLVFHSELINRGLNPVMVGAPYVRLFCPVLTSLFDLVGIEFAAATRESLARLMKEKRNISMIIGGFEEATITELGKDKLYVKKRKGFIKLALRLGYELVPVFAFGENDLFWNSQLFMKARVYLSSGRMQIPGVIPWGYFWLPFLPKRIEQIRIVCGVPIALLNHAEPAQLTIEHTHSKYVKSICELYEMNKSKDNHLVIS